jgi:hypothetical protein
MNVEPLFTVAMLLALVVGFAMLAGSLRRRDLAIGYFTFCFRFTERGPTGGPRIRGIGRQDVYLLCTIIKLLEGSASGARGRAA